MKENWIDYKGLRSNLNVEEVLLHYKVKPTIKGHQHQGFCPLPTHEGRGNSPSFSMNIEKKIFNCFGCQASGNILDFAVRMEGGDPNDKRDFSLLARRIHDKFCMPSLPPPAQTPPKLKAIEQPTNEAQSVPPLAPSKILVNPPLDFELRDLDPKHPYLVARGFTEETINHFGLGYCSRGIMRDRVAIPLKSSEGQLIGYAGRTVIEGNPKSETPRYMFPASRERNGIRYEFHKGLFVYNLDWVNEPLHEIIIVEGFTSVWWLHQHRIPHCGALMGSSCTSDQGEIIIRKTNPGATILIMPDGDPAGEKFAASVFAHVGHHRNCRLIKLPDKKQPTDCDLSELQNLLGLFREDLKISIPLKTRVITLRTTKEEGILELGRTFPTIEPLLANNAAWNAEKFDEQMSSATSGQRTSAQFLLNVWDPQREWKVGRLETNIGLKTWTPQDRKAYSKWASDPWWCNGSIID